MNSPSPLPANVSAHRLAWRWHFVGAFIAIPFIAWQSVTGLIYLWSSALADARFPAQRFVSAPLAPDAGAATLDAQVERVTKDHPHASLLSFTTFADPTRATEFVLASRDGVFASYVHPRDARALGDIAPTDWTLAWSRSLHGGTPLGDAGSWLLEIGACWTIVMTLTGLYLWWPRGERRGFRGILIPRSGQGARVFWRDLHATVAVWLSLLLVLFLLTALPWTRFWGGTVLAGVQRALGQATPPAAGFAPVLPDRDATSRPLSYDALVTDARTRGASGDLTIRFGGAPAAAVNLRAGGHHGGQYALYDARDGALLSSATERDLPAIPRLVGAGVALHEGRALGAAGPWANTAFALLLMWLAITGTLAWWRRRPARTSGLPPRPERWPAAFRVAGAALAIVFPLFGATLLVALGVERLSGART